MKVELANRLSTLEGLMTVLLDVPKSPSTEPKEQKRFMAKLDAVFASISPAIQFARAELSGEVGDSTVNALRLASRCIMPFVGEPAVNPFTNGRAYLERQSTINELADAQRELRTAWYAATANTSPTPEPAATPSDNGLSDDKKCIVQAMLDLNITDDPDTNQTRDTITERAFGKLNLRDKSSAFAELRTRGVTMSKSGQQGGIWFTPAGLLRAKKVQSING